MDLDTSLPDPALAQGREPLNAAIHGIGLALSIAAAVALASRFRTAGEAVVGGLFTGAMILVYAASTLSHAITEPRWRRNLQSLDRGVIYGLIA